MDEERLPRKILEWCPPGKQRKGRTRKSWMQEITTGMREMGINNLEWVDGEGSENKNKIKTLGTERRENIKNMCKNKIIIGTIIGLTN